MVGVMDCAIIVDEEFRKLIPPPMEEERFGLEEKLLREGCIDPLTWQSATGTELIMRCVS